MNGDFPHDEDSPTRTSIGAATLLRKDRLLAGRYRIIAPLGAGGMGLVYRAHDERLNIDLAIKVLRPERVPDESMIDRFEREIVLAREVSHPNVVRIHDIGQDENLHFITMDLVEGQSLRDLMEDEGPLDGDTAAGIIASIADGLDAAHARGVVHRDLKPANILLDKSGQPFISDFGVARSLHNAGLTRTGMIVGSPDYLAPEQASGDEIDGRADVYALGLILYEMLSGNLPFRGGTIEEMIAQRTTGEPRKLAVSAGVPKWLQRVVYRCLQRDPADRFASAGELARALRSRSLIRMKLSISARRNIGRAIGLLAIIGLVLVGSRFIQDSGNASTMRLAVLTLSNDTGKPELSWLATGLNDVLATRFSESANVEFVETARITETLSDLNFDPGKLDDRAVSQLFELLGTDRIVTGAIRSDGEGLRIDAQLKHGDRRKAQPIVATSASALPRELIANFAENLRQKLSVPRLIDDNIVLSGSAAALELYTQGLESLRKADPEAAISRLEKSVQTDPGFAAAWLHLAEAYDFAGFADKARQAIGNAAAQAGNDDTRTALQIAALRAGLDGDFEQSREFLARLIERFPSDVPARMSLAEAYGDEGLFEQASGILESVVGNDPSHPRAWFLLGKYAVLSGDSRRAIDDYLVRDLVIQNRLKNEHGKANVLNAMGIAYGRLGQIGTARENYEKAADLRRQIGDRRGMATSLNNLARLEMMAGNFAAARISLEQARAASEELGDQRGYAAFTNTLGTLEEEAGNYAGALEKFRAALKIREDLGDRRALNESYNNVGFAYYMLGELDNAGVYWKLALDESRELKNRDAEMQALQSLGLLHKAQGEWDSALNVFVEALNIARELDYPEAQAVSTGNIGQIAGLQGRFETALSQLDSALAILEPVGDNRGLAEFGLRRAEVLARIGLQEQSRAQLDRVRLWLDETPNLEQQAEYLRLSSAIAGTASDDSVNDLQQALDAATDSGSVAAVMRTRLEQATQALQNNDFTEALDLARSVAERAGKTGYKTIQLRGLVIQIRAFVAENEMSDVTAENDEMLKLLDSQLPFADAYSIRALASDILNASGDKAAATRQLEIAVREVNRVRGNLPGVALERFDADSDVTRLQQDSLVDEE